MSAIPIRYLYNTAERALAKARTLNRRNAAFDVSDADGTPLTLEDLEQRAKR